MFEIDEFICIYCMGYYGARTYYALTEHGYKVDVFGDMNPHKHGESVFGVECISYEKILELPKDNLIIVAKKNPSALIETFREKGFTNVISYEAVLRELEDKKPLQKTKALHTKEDVEEIKRSLEKSTSIEAVMPSQGEGKLRVLEVNYTDLPGRVFDGYDLQQSLNGTDMLVEQVVVKKHSNDDKVIEISDLAQCLEYYPLMEEKHSVSGLLSPYGESLSGLPQFQMADIVHYHIIHNWMISLLDLPRLMKDKTNVWTIHDLWAITGKCLHPLECEKWRDGCHSCPRYMEEPFTMREDNAAFMWEIKKEIYSQINPHIIVTTDYMMDYIKKSPLTKHFSNVHKIPFGVDITKYHPERKAEYKSLFGIKNDKLVIGFRVEDALIKGCRYIYDALSRLEFTQDIELLCVGWGTVPEEIKNYYPTHELGWIEDEEKTRQFLGACDVFLMPSLAESFGLMAVEAMAAGTTVVCFKGTVLEEITNAPNIGIAVEYRSAEEIANAIKQFVHNPEEVVARGRAGHLWVKDKYKYNEYVRKHEELYRSLKKGKVV